MLELQGALNVPIIKDVLAVRFAGDVVRRDGFTKSLSTGQKQDQRHREGYRLGINFTPTDWLNNYTLLQPIHVHRSEEHTSELQSLMRLSYAVFCLKTKIYTHI